MRAVSAAGWAAALTAWFSIGSAALPRPAVAAGAQGAAAGATAGRAVQRPARARWTPSGRMPHGGPVQARPLNAGPMPGDMNGDGSVDLRDFEGFYRAWLNRRRGLDWDHRADMDGDHELTVADAYLFLSIIGAR